MIDQRAVRHIQGINTCYTRAKTKPETLETSKPHPTLRKQINEQTQAFQALHESANPKPKPATLNPTVGA